MPVRQIVALLQINHTAVTYLFPLTRMATAEKTGAAETLDTQNPLIANLAEQAKCKARLTELQKELDDQLAGIKDAIK